ncbi:hypothetical protein MA16_Dca007148 [Dendrobium catenatum]|uniref:Uncharacterized protein n=1 Tax=Dendrobium catenatum TaxID=906689 RepID=A0A2I0W3Z7_9ASPA|nr:hypothetical protein MA16_Dca007148 [Dendrobium catenatum]
MSLKATRRGTYYLIMGVGTSCVFFHLFFFNKYFSSQIKAQTAGKSMTKNIERLAKIMPMVELGSNKSSFDFFTWGESKPVAIHVCDLVSSSLPFNVLTVVN